MFLLIIVNNQHDINSLFGKKFNKYTMKLNLQTKYQKDH